MFWRLIFLCVANNIRGRYRRSQSQGYLSTAEAGRATRISLIAETISSYLTIAAAELSTEQYEVISQKVTYRLAQRPGSYVISPGE